MYWAVRKINGDIDIREDFITGNSSTIEIIKNKNKTKSKKQNKTKQNKNQKPKSKKQKIIYNK